MSQPNMSTARGSDGRSYDAGVLGRDGASLVPPLLPAPTANRVRLVPDGVDWGASPYPTVSTLVLAVGRLVRSGDRGHSRWSALSC
jgi:hypothetical protein